MRRTVLAPLVLLASIAIPIPAHAAARVSFQPTDVVLGRPLIVTLTGAPNRAGDPVHLQEKLSGTWTRIMQKTIRDDGSQRFWVRPSTVGFHRYRVVIPADGAQSRLASAAQVIPVRRWRYLSDLTPSATSGPAGTPTSGPVTINDRTFQKSLRYDADQTPSSTDWTLPFGCIEFRGVLGLDSDSDPASEAELSLYLDGVEQNLGWTPGTMQVGDENTVAGIELRGTTTLRLEHREVVAQAQAAFGDARILCAS